MVTGALIGAAIYGFSAIVANYNKDSGAGTIFRVSGTFIFAVSSGALIGSFF